MLQHGHWGTIVAMRGVALEACAGMKAEAAKAKADKAEGKDSGEGAGGKKAKKTKPNEKCPCGSKKKYKKCCGANY